MYRVLEHKLFSNGKEWRIKQKCKFLCFTWSQYVCHHWGEPWEWETEEKAKEALRDLEEQRTAYDRGWSEV